MSAKGQQQTSSKIVSDVRFGAVSGRKTHALEIQFANVCF
jgi:hypothetical protein